ncbi:TPA: hypothetical protein ACGEYH_003165 [Providencia rettgeri]
MTISISSTLKSEKFINTNDKSNSPMKSLSLSKEIRKVTNIGGCETDKPNYQKQYFAMSTCHFEPCEQREINQLKYSPPVEKITLPYKYHERIKTYDQFLIMKAPRIFSHAVSIKNEPFISKKQDTELMSIDKIHTSETKVFKDFHLNRSANQFSNFIFEIKSIHEKSTRYLKNTFKKNNNEELCVKFETGKAKIVDKATIARKNLIKQHEKINHAKPTNSVVYTMQQEKADLYNNYKTLLNEMHQVESKANDLIMESSKNGNQSQYHKLFEESNIADMINSSELTDDRLKKINDIFNEMKSVIKMFEDYIDDSESNKKLAWDDYGINLHNLPNKTLNTQNRELTKQDLIDDAIHMINTSASGIISKDAKNELNEFFNDNHQSSTFNLYSSNESLNSNSSGYQSDRNYFSGNSVYFSDDFPHQEENKNIRLISENFSNLNKNEITDNKANKTRLPEKEKNRITKKPKKTQAEKMEQLAKGNSSTGYIHPSRRNKINNSNKMEQIKQLNKKIAELEALKKEYQEMAIVTSTQEKQAAQLILKAKQGPVKSRKI